MNRLILTAWLLSLVSVPPAIAADARGVAVLPVLQAGQGQARALLVGVNDYERLERQAGALPVGELGRERAVSPGLLPRFPRGL